ncbi:MAG: glycoside hydrolase family 3 N-terminal domain-containing protein [Flavobacteriaceae bacterium]
MKLNLRILFILFTTSLYAQQPDPFETLNIEARDHWVDEQMKNMSTDQKIGQLFMINVYSDEREDRSWVKKMIRKYHVGGLIFFQGTPQREAELYNEYQKKSKIPLMVGFDGEWGLDMRLENTFKYPFNMTLGAIEDNGLIEAFGYRLAVHHKRIGIQINFAPVVDINTNPANPIIGNRSFGENKYRVTNKAAAFIRGMESGGVIANAKHFPGHGDTATDSHKELPYLDFDRDRLNDIELYPYYQLMQSRLGSVMVGHLNVPVLVNEEGVPTSLSYEVVTELLQEEMGFQGLVFTDALNMKGAANYGSAGAVDLKAFMAGNDMLLYSNDVEAGFKTIKKAFKDGSFTEDRLNKSVRKILKAKYWAGLADYNPVETENIDQDIKAPEDYALLEELFDAAITLVKNENNALPIRDLRTKRAYLALGDASSDAFVQGLKNYQDVQVLDANDEDLLLKINQFDELIIGFHKPDDKFWRSYKFESNELELLNELSKLIPTNLVVFASPYALIQVPSFEHINQVVVAYQNDEVAQRLTAEKIYGARSFKGSLPVSINENFKEGTGLKTSELNRLAYAYPFNVGVDALKLDQVDQLSQVIVDSTMAPGGVILAARDGKIFYHKAFGKHRYGGERETQKSDIYDLASVTKILGGLPMLMKGEESHYFDVNDNLGEHFVQLKGSNKDTVTIKEALSHVGRIKAWIAYYKSTIDSTTSQPLEEYYAAEKSSDYAIEVAENLYLRTSYKDSIYEQIAQVDQRVEVGYKYSGLLYYLIGDWVERTYGMTLDQANSKFFYDPIGAYELGYNPLERGIEKDRIVPTEQDDYYRHQELQGYVHDMGAAMMGGVNGNAGLFGSALDVAKMMQLYLQGGVYGGERILENQTLRVFNKRYFEQDSIRRGLGFDKPSLDPEIKSSAKSASAHSFGHSGFTGTFAWADPETGLVYIFLSNRVYPSMVNNRLGESDMRTRIHEAFYEALLD